MAGLNLGIVGCTGAVGKEVLRILEKRKFPIRTLRCFASEKSEGVPLLFNGKQVIVEKLTPHCFESLDLTLFCAGRKVSSEWVPIALKSSFVIDNSSYFRMDPNVPLVIPEINPEAIEPQHRLIASPNCSTSILLMALFPLHRKFSLKRVVVATYQAASGAGYLAMQELQEEAKAYLEGRPFTRTIFPHPYAFNLFPHNSPMQEDGYVEEEAKIKEESCKILNDPNLRIHATCVRVPVLRAHAEAVNATFEKPITPEEAYQVLSKARA